MGGSLAGLLAARVLADHADAVTVVERDRYPDGPEHRAGLPQDRHTHVLLESGRHALERLLPGIMDEMRAHGVPWVGMPNDILQWQAGRWYRRTPATKHLVTGSRPLTDWLVRRRVLADPRIRLVEGTEVTGLTGDAGRVRGVRLRARGAGRAGEEPGTLAADLVLDASGRSSRAPGWLTELGAEPPHEERIDIGLAYATRFYRAGGNEDVPFRGIYVIPDATQPYGAVLLPTEGDRWTALLSGLRGSEPPTDEAGFLDFANRLPHPLFRDWLDKAEPLSAIHGYRATANVRRRYDRSGRRPAGFLATGEALCAFNPVYGQGMTVAALSALALREALNDPRRVPTTRRVQRALFATARPAWNISAGADKLLPGAVGNAAALRAVDRPAARYMARVVRRAPGNPAVGAAFRAVTALTAPPSSLFAPAVARAVLLGPDPEAPAEPPLEEEPDAGR
ncbi:NAD(P)/FAD-dependent oxidoreductase [Streptomyces sp. I05A-00742]|uniref:FAD-dependent oxidoreductase n=1 Tax=Streptomyces sp. I05A-00742 TaxID=2732853 RepID=UPI0014895B31|nr:monooxygenase [Streptomyces sp. I05A-00742]